MKADLSRDSFDPNQNFQRVLLQQGRVLVDADWNEQVSILLEQMRLLARAVAGPYAGPKPPGFAIIGARDTAFGALSTNNGSLPPLSGEGDFYVRPGLYWVEGHLAQNHTTATYREQPFLNPEALERGTYLVFLDVWERHVTPLEVDGITDNALRGIETAHRSQLVWQVRAEKFDETEPFKRDGDELLVTATGPRLNIADGHNPDKTEITTFFEAFAQAKDLRPEGRGTLVVSLNPSGTESDGAAAASPQDAPRQYRGTQHRLYRVEVHRGGDVKPDQETDVTFKWSRDNGSVVFPVTTVEGRVVTVRSIPGDSGRRPTEGSYVELLDENYALTQHMLDRPRQQFRVEAVEPVAENYRVTLQRTDGKTDDTLPGTDHNLLRVWDHEAREGLSLHEGAILVPKLEESAPGAVPLEDGLHVSFGEGSYVSGDYWLIPARAGISPQPWEDSRGNSENLPPQFVEHQAAPLAAIEVAEGGVDRKQDLRLTFEKEIVAQ